ncbi:exodeoxyribonuclease VII small subunit [Verrucomicrobia bacterium LW23]|nr:exodeoxyribonuclease VII small subunit [Verrucomicrobia bacterium LW23]
MENAELPLEKLIERYESGMRLVQICSEKLAEAEQKVEILGRSRSDEPSAASAQPGTPVTGRGSRVIGGAGPSAPQSTSASSSASRDSATPRSPSTGTGASSASPRPQDGNDDDDTEKEEEISLF